MTYLPEVRDALTSAVDQGGRKPVTRWHRYLQRAGTFAIPAMTVLITAGIVAVFVTAGLHSRAATTTPAPTTPSQAAHSGQSFARYNPVSANVLSTPSPHVWYETVRIDEGSTDGIRRGDPVIANGALVGDISSVGAKYAVVAGLDSAKFAVEVRILESGAHRSSVGVLMPVPGTPKALEVAFLPKNADLANGDQVVTAGYTNPGHNPISECPPGIPVGTISDLTTLSNLNQTQLTNTSAGGVSPIVNLQKIRSVEILTKRP